MQMGRAEYYSAAQNRLGHYLGISIGGGECNNVGKTDLPVKHRLGWTAELAVRYEMQYRNWAWGIGVEGACQTLNNSTEFTDNLNRIDMDGDAFNYQYVYTAFAEKDLLANIAIPIYVGKQFNHVYTLLGLAVEIPIWARYTTNTNMYTQGIYEWSISPVVSDATNDFSPLGFYPASDYTYTDNYQERLRLTPFLEVGYSYGIPTDILLHILLILRIWIAINSRIIRQCNCLRSHNRYGVRCICTRTHIHSIRIEEFVSNL